MSKQVTKRWYTVFCQQASGGGTIHINSVLTSSVKQAIKLGIEECMADWGWTEKGSVHCLGVADGNIEILHWEDLGE